MPKLTLVVGLPGSGKSTLIARLGREQPGLFVVHDFKKETLDGTAQFSSSRHFDALIDALRAGRDAAIDDIGFIHPEARRWAKKDIRDALDGDEMEFAWVFFENNPNPCEANIRRRARVEPERDLEKEIAYLYKHSPGYRVPDRLGTVKVWDQELER